LGDQLAKRDVKDLAYDNTVVVLADEKMLSPVISSLPEKIKDVNITMGYPLQNTSLAAFIEILIDLYKHAKTSSKEQRSFYYKTLLSFLSHPYIVSFNEDSIRNKIIEIENHNRIYIKESEISELFPEGFNILTSQAKIDFNFLLKTLEILYTSRDKDIEKLELEFIYTFYKELKRIGEIIETNNFSLSDQIFYSIVREIINSITLPFMGEPLSGLQIMGTLETRCLNFKNVFILNMNEGIIPPKNIGNSYIPYFLRKAFDLPTFDHHDKVLSYYFYRLILNAENVTLLYNAETNSQEGEISRYIKQLKYDLNVNINEKILTHSIQTKGTHKISIQKDDKVKQRLSRYLASSPDKKRFTPSAFNTYLDCSLRFYFRYVADLYEKDEVQEEVDQRVLGNILHDSMEYIYTEFLEQRNDGNQITQSDFKGLSKLIDKGIIHAFGLYFQQQDEKVTFEGQNVIIKEVAEKYIRQILNSDKRYVPFEIVSLENKVKKYLTEFPVEIDGDKDSVNLRGIIDRVDLKGNQIRILDYKSGADDKSFKDIESLFDKGNTKRNKAVFQTILYSWIYNELHSNKEQLILPALYNVREMFSEDFDFRILKKENRQSEIIQDIKPYFEEFNKHLKILIEEIYNPELTFTQTEDEKKCEYCPYAGICRRD